MGRAFSDSSPPATLIASTLAAACERAPSTPESGGRPAAAETDDHLARRTFDIEQLFDRLCDRVHMRLEAKVAGAAQAFAVTMSQAAAPALGQDASGSQP